MPALLQTPQLGVWKFVHRGYFIHFYSLLFPKHVWIPRSKGAAGGAVALNVLSWGRRVEIFKGGGGWLWQESKCLARFHCAVTHLLHGVFWIILVRLLTQCHEKHLAKCCFLLLPPPPQCAQPWEEARGHGRASLGAAIKPFQHFWSKN